jgi:acyl-CoA thioester hydrolase
MSSDAASEVAAKPEAKVFTFPIRVYYEDTDAGGVVYNANYLKFLERGRTEWLRALGYSQDKIIQEMAIGFLVASINIQYKRAARLDDELIVTVAIAERKRFSLTFGQTIVYKNDPSMIIVKADVQVACVDLKLLKPRPLPEFVDL